MPAKYELNAFIAIPAAELRSWSSSAEQGPAAEREMCSLGQEIWTRYSQISELKDIWW